jgi:hypothetical protein
MRPIAYILFTAATAALAGFYAVVFGILDVETSKISPTVQAVWWISPLLLIAAGMWALSRAVKTARG